MKVNQQRVKRLEQAREVDSPIEPMEILHGIWPDDLTRSKELEAVTFQSPQIVDF